MSSKRQVTVAVDWSPARARDEATGGHDVIHWKSGPIWKILALNSPGHYFAGWLVPVIVLACISCSINCFHSLVHKKRDRTLGKRHRVVLVMLLLEYWWRFR
ncbi:hypothetical protein NPIL_350041 [Nephila pilipes]|uniref:Uncharacterized protein n=1 Tax=Nephila pilipes TaxID=299642 RepID=A0A8X6NV49_NEPPI|nr:hypothetical protein NPIL_350041 [Nephila pilipes]